MAAPRGRSFEKGKPRPKGSGRAKGTPNQRTILLRKIDELKRKEGVDFWMITLKMAINNARDGKDSSLLNGLVKKLLPDQVEAGGFDGAPLPQAPGTVKVSFA